jgi:glycosyltransferase involved in cell wall biosynthesis
MKDKTKISILFLIGNFGVGGKERQLSELVHNLPKDKITIHLLAKSHNTHYLDKIKDDLATFHSFNREHFRVSDIFRVAKIISSIKPDIVYSWATTTSHFCLFAKAFTPHKYTLINGSIRNAPSHLSFRLRFERFLYSFYTAVVSNSNSGLEVYKQQNRKGRFLLYNGFDFARVPHIDQLKARNLLKFPKDKFIVVMVASLTEKKDHETFLRSIRECSDRDARFMFYVVGDGAKRQYLERYAKELCIDNYVEFLGYREDVELILNAADLSVLTSTSWLGEGISNSIIESLGCDTPVIATESNGTKEIIQDGENGFLIKNGDYKSLSDKIIFLKNNPDILKRFSVNGVNLIKRKFSIEAMIKTFTKIVESANTL